MQANDLWVPKTANGAGGPGGAGGSGGPGGVDAQGGIVEFEDLASSLGVDLGGWSWGAQFGDLNNDDTQDLYLVN